MLNIYNNNKSKSSGRKRVSERRSSPSPLLHYDGRHKSGGYFETPRAGLHGWTDAPRVFFFLPCSWQPSTGPLCPLSAEFDCSGIECLTRVNEPVKRCICRSPLAHQEVSRSSLIANEAPPTGGTNFLGCETSKPRSFDQRFTYHIAGFNEGH